MQYAFLNNTAKDASDDKLEEWVCALTSRIDKQQERLMAINHFQMARMIKSLNRRNAFTQWYMVILTLFCVIIGILNLSMYFN